MKVTPDKKTQHGANRTAAEATIAAMHAAGLLEDIDAARIATLRTLATVLDQQPDNASLWREYRAAEQAIRSTTHHEPDDFANLLADLSAEVGNQT
jgi:hypothetical protein